MPESSKSIRFFHVSLLKKQIGPNHTPKTELQAVRTERNIILEWLFLNEDRLKEIAQVLIQQSQSHEEDATLMDWYDITSIFPNFSP